MEKHLKSETVLKVLSLEDSLLDFEIISEQLADAGFDLNITRVDKENEFASALRGNNYDIILADFNLPGFDAFGALRVALEICPEIPFICISGSIGEDTAIELLKAGAVDYVLKDKPERLPFAVKRALDDAREKSAYKQAQKELTQHYNALSKLNQFSIELAMLSSDDNIESFITNKIKEIAGAEVVTFSDYIPDERMTVVREFDMEPGFLDKITGLIGRQIKKIRANVSDEMYQEMTLDIIGIRKTLHEASFGAISRPVSAAIQRLLNVDRFIGVAYLAEGILYGTSLLAMKKGNPDPSREILQNFINLSAVSLRRKRAEVALKESEERFRTLLNNAPITIFSTDSKGIFTLHEGKALEGIGMNPGENVGESAYDLFSTLTVTESGDKESKGKDVINRVLGGETITGVTYVKDVCFDNQFAPLFDTEGKIAGLVGVATDITERNRAEEALKENNSRLELAMESANMAWWEMDITTGKVIFDIRKTNMLGYRPEEFHHYEDFMVLVHSEDREIAMDAMRRHIYGQSDKYEAEYRILTKSGEYKWFYDIGTIVKKDAKGLPLKVAGLVIDITGRKKAEENIRKLNEELEQRVIQRTAQLESANEELESFSYSVSHDLRAPLRGIDGFTQILMDDYSALLDVEGRRICNVIRDNAQRMGRLIDDLLAFSRLGRSELNRSLVEMKTVVHTVYNEITENLESNSIEFNVGDLSICHCDPNLIRQVWANLLSNSIKYSSKKEKPVIEVNCRKENNFCTYSISDNGAGFDMASYEKLFGVFQRLHNAREFEGTGIGLASVQRIVKRHGGEVWAEGKVGEGATFYFSLPVIETGSANDPALAPLV